ncbi:hypothetical protein [Ruegeria arenilitoris]|uniref:hypothetical protein n=1 Tax=Ruegeria arenilitoris TaxID=1173585 RepID=UPI00147C75FA|nr:hypothetical protein [Ruegeria arenilitoris]
MVTKAELEAQVADLRRQLAEQTAPREQAQRPEPHDTVADRIAENIDNWTGQLEEALTELEDLPHKRPILFALGIFTLGYLLGRSR